MITITTAQLLRIIIIANGAIIAFVIAMNGILKKREPNQTLFFLSITLLQVIFLSVLINPGDRLLSSLHFVLFFLFYSLLYYYFEKLCNSDFYLNRTFYFNMLPSIVVGILLLIFPLNSPDIPVKRYGAIALGVSYFLYSIAIEIKIIRYWHSAFSKTISILMVLLLLDIFFFTALIISGYLFNSDFLEWGHILLSVIVLLLHLLNSRYPVFLDSIDRNRPYKKSRIQGIDIDELTSRLNRLFDEQKIFLDESISLESLAAQANISVHQLSEFINSHWHISFFNLINRFRVQEAKRILVENSDANILHVAFQVGFNNKASFNAAFKKFTGTTPLKFRTNNLRK
jgi:AraC-like DNA-binding protein